MTRSGRIPDAIRRFVQQHLFSVAELEALLLVRSAPQQAWQARELADRLYIGEAHARLVLDALHRHGLMACRDEGFHFRPSSDALRGDVDALADAYPRLLIPIAELIHAASRSPRPHT
jgi:DNA-binding IclR family transcriptional regulator